MKNLKFKAEITTMPKRKPVDYNTSRDPTKRIEPHVEGNSPILIVNITYWNSKKGIFDWNSALNLQLLQQELKANKNWHERRPYIATNTTYCRDGCGCAQIPRKYYPKSGIEKATDQQIVELGIATLKV